jgi:hypothetical protein
VQHVERRLLAHGESDNPGFHSLRGTSFVLHQVVSVGIYAAFPVHIVLDPVLVSVLVPLGAFAVLGHELSQFDQSEGSHTAFSHVRSPFFGFPVQ